MQVKDIMTKKVLCASPDMKISQAADLLFRHGFHGMPVIENGKIVGIMTENDFFSKTNENNFLPSYIKFLSENKIDEDIPKDKKDDLKKLLNSTVRDIMTKECVTIFPNSDIMNLLELIRQTRFNTIPVVDWQNNLVGIVTLVDTIGLIKQNRSEMLSLLNSGVILSDKREVDRLADGVEGFWKKTFFLIGKKEIKAWKSMLIIAFIAGITAAFIWNASVKVKNDPAVNIAIPDRFDDNQE